MMGRWAGFGYLYVDADTEEEAWKKAGEQLYDCNDVVESSDG